MRILINTISLGKAGYLEILLRSLENICLRNGYELICLKDQNCLSFTSSANTIELHPPAKKLLYSLWKKTALTAAIKKVSPEILITWEPVVLKDRIRQIIVPSEIVDKLHRGKNTPSKATRFRQGIDGVDFIVFSEKERRLLADWLGITAERIFLIYNIQNIEARKISESEKDCLKEEVGKGNEFFLATGFQGQSSLTALLKAFSVFKKWQRSKMNLLIDANDEAGIGNLRELLKNYKFKDSIVPVEINTAGNKNILLAAYAVILGDSPNPDLTTIMEAVFGNVAVLVPAGSTFAEVLGEGAFYYQANDKDSLAQVMLRSFREENEKGKKVKEALGMANAYPTGYFEQTLESVLLKNMSSPA